MKTCNDHHPEIAFVVDECPLCKVLRKCRALTMLFDVPVPEVPKPLFTNKVSGIIPEPNSRWIATGANPYVGSECIVHSGTTIGDAYLIAFSIMNITTPDGKPETANGQLPIAEFLTRWSPK